MGETITAELMLMGYAQGVFPMAQGAEARELEWYEPRMRGVMPLDEFHISGSLRKAILRGDYEIALNRDFAAVVRACAAREETWINAELHALYADLHERGAAHSVEVWRGGRLVGGLYGVSLGGAFFGESMFSAQRDCSKIAMAYLVGQLRASGFSLLDMQFLTPHLQSLGGVEIARARYRALLSRALTLRAEFAAPALPEPVQLIQRLTQTS